MAQLTKAIALDETLQDVVGQLTTLNTKIIMAKGDKGDTYTLTSQDKQDIANIASTLIDISGKADKTTVEAIENKIPTEASTTNKLADKDFVNSSISTNTANFVGTFNSVAELEAYTGTKTNNDYAFVKGTDTAGNTTYSRYKYVASSNSWVFEYVLNNSSFTASQWANINFDMTTKQDTISDLATIRSGAEKGATAVQHTDYATSDVTGVFKTANGVSVGTSTGNIGCDVRSSSQYASDDNSYFIGKGTLENLKKEITYTDEEGTTGTFYVL